MLQQPSYIHGCMELISLAKVIMTEKTSITMPMLVANLKEGYVTDYGVLMLAVLLCSIPTVIIFFVLQKQFAEGITGAVK